MKKWQEPSIKDLNISSTKNDDVCPNAGGVLTPPPQGGTPCIWKNSDGKCTHHKYGQGNPKNWPCEKADTTIPGIS